MIQCKWQRKMGGANMVSDQVFSGGVDKLKETSEIHAACLLLLDCSGSMADEQFRDASSDLYPYPIDKLNQALEIFHQQAQADQTSRNVIDVCAITFGGARPNIAEEVKVLNEQFVPIGDWTPPTLKAYGRTPLWEALEVAIDIAGKQVEACWSEGIETHIPWIVIFTDGIPTDSDNENRVRELIRQANTGTETNQYGHIKIWIIATRGADLKVCKSITNRVIAMDDHDYTQIFDWLRKSMVTLTRSKVGDKISVDMLPENCRVVQESWVND